MGEVIGLDYFWINFVKLLLPSLWWIYVFNYGHFCGGRCLGRLQKILLWLFLITWALNIGWDLITNGDSNNSYDRFSLCVSISLRIWLLGEVGTVLSEQRTFSVARVIEISLLGFLKLLDTGDPSAAVLE